ncbi:MAG: AAA family ATPase, partial [Candidatus Methanomethyliaceae archaeon]|nr:AAA family ATPase [Candidatus Methanomethyliaceae archaeon]
MTFDIIAKELRRPTIFKNEGTLLPDYVPINLIHREEQMRALSRIFRIMIDSPGIASQKAILIGDVGVGKTAVAKRFGFTLETIAKERKINLKYIHVNCYKDRTFFLIMKRIIQTIMPGFPDRGYSAQELFHTIWNFLDNENSYLLITLDEMDFLTEGEAPIYFLSRLSDEYLNRKQRLSLILIVRRIESLEDLDGRTRSTLLHNIVKFERYNSNQLYDIVKMRGQEALKEEAISEEVLRMIAEIAASKGDARYALELLWRAGKYADAEGSNRILPEHVRK